MKKILAVIPLFILLWCLAAGAVSADTETYSGSVSFTNRFQSNENIVLPSFDTQGGSRMLQAVGVIFEHGGYCEFAADNDDPHLSDWVFATLESTWDATGPDLNTGDVNYTQMWPAVFLSANVGDGYPDPDYTAPDGTDFGGPQNYGPTQDNDSSVNLNLYPTASLYATDGASTVTFVIDISDLDDDLWWQSNDPTIWELANGPQGIAITATLIYTYNTPTAVSMASLDATAQADGILVRWETGSELNNVGFDVYRATAPDGEPAQINDAVIMADGFGTITGGSYDYLDGSAQPGVTYWYWIEDLETDGSVERHGPVSATALAANAPTVVKVGTLSAQQIATGTTTWFNAIYEDEDGATDIRYADLLISPDGSTDGAVWLRCNVQANKLLISHDDLDDRRGDILPSERGKIKNLFPRPITQRSTVRFDDKRLEVKWVLRFESAHVGSYTIYSRAIDMAGHDTGWVAQGDWTVIAE